MNFKKYIIYPILFFIFGCNSNSFYDHLEGPLTEFFSIQKNNNSKISELNKMLEQAHMKLDSLKMRQMEDEIKTLKSVICRKLTESLNSNNKMIPFEQNEKKEFYVVNNIKINSFIGSGNGEEIGVQLDIQYTKGPKCTKYKIMRLQFLNVDNNVIVTDHFQMNDTVSVLKSNFFLEKNFAKFSKIIVL